ncbi:MAG: tetratricopeptide repeat protein [Rhodanobacter sp.]
MTDHQPAQIFAEDALHEQFAGKADSTVDPQLDRVIDEWASVQGRPLLLVGSTGSGRAAALCRFAGRQIARGQAVVFHHATLTPAGSEPPRLLWQMLAQLRRIAEIPQWPPPKEADLREMLPNWLARACARGPLWLLVADIDAVADPDGNVSWLPDYWPPNLHVAASVEPGHCADHLRASGWLAHTVNCDFNALAAASPDADHTAGGVDPETLATVGRLLALARTPLDTDTLVTLTGAEPPQTGRALAHLQSLLLQPAQDRWAPAHRAARKTLLDRYLPDESRRVQCLEALAGHAEPLTAAAYWRMAAKPDQVLEALLLKNAILAAETPAGRMEWLAEWSVLEAGSLVEALLPVTSVLLGADQRLLLAAAELVEAVGEVVPEDWLDRAASGRDQELCARALLWQARATAETGNWAEAARRAQEVLDLPCSEQTQSSARHELARAAEGSGDLDQAATLYTQALKARELRYGKGSELLLPAMANLIGVLRAANKLVQAKLLARRALNLARDRYGAAHPATAVACDQLGAVAYAGADYSAAEGAYRETLEIVRADFGPTHPVAAAALHNLGTVLDAQRAFVEAEQCYREALTIREAAYGRDSEETAVTLHNLAAVLETVGRADEAERLYRETTDIWEKLHGAEHPATLSSLTNLAGVLGSRRAYADAEVCYRAAAEGWRRLVGDDHPNTLGVLAELGRLYAEGGKVDLAGPLLEHVVEVGHRVLGDTNTNYVNSVCALAALWREHGREEEARELVTTTLTNVERGLGLLAPPVQQLRFQLDALNGTVVH